MKNKIIFYIFFLFTIELYSQDISVLKNNETIWDQGVPVCPDDPYILSLSNKIDIFKIRDSDSLTPEEKGICCEIGLAFYARRQYDAADWYFYKSINRNIETQIAATKEYVYLVKEVPAASVEKEDKLEPAEAAELKKDIDFLNTLPKSFDNISKQDMSNLKKEIENRIKKLIAEKDSLLNVKASQEIIDSKDGTIKTLKKENQIIDLTIKNDDLNIENKDLEIEKNELRKYLLWAVIGITLLGLFVVALFQRKTIKVQDSEIDNQLKDIAKKNTYLEHAARIIRHDMHSGINTYIPRGLISLEKRLTEEEAKKMKIDTSLKMIKEGLNHTQKVYKSVYEFTNLVKQNVVLIKKEVSIKDLLTTYLSNTSYFSSVQIEDSGNLEVNETLFCNAIDNLIKNGLKYNDSSDKYVKIYREDNYLIVQDNGKGLSKKEFEKICFTYINKNKKDTNSEDKGLGLNISLAILTEHGFDLTCEKNEIGTKMKIKI